MKYKFSFGVAFTVFIGWMQLVGNPSEKETIIGLVISGLSGLYVCNKLNCLNI
jgi:hypothetical protein